jgi:hypothetical protein
MGGAGGLLIITAPMAGQAKAKAIPSGLHQPIKATASFSCLTKVMRFCLVVMFDALRVKTAQLSKTMPTKRGSKGGSQRLSVRFPPQKVAKCFSFWRRKSANHQSA